MRNNIILIISLNFLFNVFSQKQRVKDLDLLDKESDSISNQSRKYFFKKAYFFYKEKKFDSCYLYSSRALETSSSEKESDILNYFQGASAIRKKLLKQALKNISNISNENDYETLKQQKLGRIYFSFKNYDKAIYHYKKWEILSFISKKKLKKSAYHNLGLLYVHKKEYHKAKEYFTKELSLMKLNDTLALIRYKMDLANVYYNQYLDDEAISLFKESYDLAKNFSDLTLKQNSSENMAYVEKGRKKFDKSVEYFIETIKWKDSISKNDNILELAERDKKMALAQKQQEIVIQDEKLKRQKVVQNGLLFGASGLLVFLGLLAFFYKKLKTQNGLITQQKEELNSANKTKNYLFSVVSHDLRSPMNTIKYQHEQLKKHIASNNLEGIKEANNTAITVTESTSHLLNNVLHWSLEQSNQMVFSKKEQPLKPIVEHVLVDYENLIEANDIEIETNYIKNSLVTIDRESIKIVLRNLLDNAIKYMNGNGKITVEIGVKTTNEAFISVKDTGVGISEERLQKINALQGVSIDKINRSEGVGLGLILCQMLVKKNDGNLVFESEEGKGTKVSILLPIFN